MTSKIFDKLAIVTAGAILSLGIMEGHSASAAIITYDLTLTVDSSTQIPEALRGQKFNGFFSYDDSQIITYPRFRGDPSSLTGDITFPTDFGLDITTLTRDLSPTRELLPITYTYTKENLVSPSRLTSGTFLRFTEKIPGFFSFELSSPQQPSNSLVQTQIRINNFSNNLGFGGFQFNRVRGSDIPLFGGVTASLREPTAVPEPETDTFAILSIFGLSWLVMKKITSSHRCH